VSDGAAGAAQPVSASSLAASASSPASSAPPEGSAAGGRSFPTAPAAIAAVLAAVAFAPGAIDMYGRWMEEEGYYGFGPFIPIACAGILWSERARLKAIPRASSLLGFPIVLAAMLVLSASVIEDVHFTQNFSLVAAIAGSVLVLLGWGVARAAWFPLCYLAFMVPLPQAAIANLTFELKIVAAKLSVKAIELWGTPVVLQGSTIHLPSTSLTVDDVCSGLRTLFALVALGTIFAYMERTRWKALLTVALTVPIAIAANVVRILILTSLAVLEIPAPAGTWQHEAAGLTVYVVALMLLMGVRSLPGDDPEAPSEAAGEAVVHGGPSALRIAALLLLLAFGAGVSLSFGWRPPHIDQTERTKAVPTQIGDWKGKDIAITPRAAALLGTKDLLMRSFASPKHRLPVDLYIVHAGDSRKVAHPPEICFTGGGFTARESSVVDLPGAPRPIRANRFVMDRDGYSVLVYYWYRMEGTDRAGYLDNQFAGILKKLRGENREGSMIRVTTQIYPISDIAGAEGRVAAFAQEALLGALGPIP